LRREIEERVRPILPPGAPIARTEVVHSIVDLERLRPAVDIERRELRCHLGLNTEDVMVAFVAAVWEVKQQLQFLQFAAPLMLRNVHVRIELVGDFDPDSDYGKACLAAVSALPDESRARVRFHGFVPDPERFYRAADLTVLASRYEGLARAMIESLACGVPMVSVDVSSAREMLEDEHTGLVVAHRDWRGLASAVLELASEPERRRAMGVRGRKLAERLFDAQTQIQRHRELYRRLVDEAHAKPEFTSESSRG